MSGSRNSRWLQLLFCVALPFPPITLRAQDFPKDDLNSKSLVKYPGVSEKAFQRQIAFFDFQNESQNKEYKYLETAIGNAVYQLTVNKYVYERTNRDLWEAHLRKADPRFSKLTQRERAQSIGQAIPVDGVVFGKFEISGDKIRISGFVLSVLSKEILTEVQKTIPISPQISTDIQEFSERLASGMKEIFMPSDRGAIWRSAVIPGWGQMYKGRHDWGRIYGAAVGTGFAFSLFSMVLWQTANSQYRNYVPEYVITPQGGTELINPAEAQVQFDRYASQARTWQTITLISVGVTLTIYVWQILDAWLFDTQHAQLGKRLAAQPSEPIFLILGGGNQSSSHENQLQNSITSGLSFGLGLSF